MPRGVNNWSFNDVVKFLREHGFVLTHTEGSHYYYRGAYAGHPRLVHVPFHGSRSIKPRTLKSIIAESGIPQSLWTGQ